MLTMPSPSPDSSPFIGGMAGQRQLMTDMAASVKTRSLPQ